MPIYEYVCKKCGKKFEALIRSSNERVVCECGSSDLERVMSTFAVSGGEASNTGSCSDGTCGLPPSPCSSGMCGL